MDGKGSGWTVYTPGLNQPLIQCTGPVHAEEVAHDLVKRQGMTAYVFFRGQYWMDGGHKSRTITPVQAVNLLNRPPKKGKVKVVAAGGG